jgi:hypothetical protein
MQSRIADLFNSFITSHDVGDTRDAFIDDLKITKFLFGGWSWKHSRFFIYKLFYDKSLRRFTFATTGVWARYKLPRGNPLKFAFIGDYEAEFLHRMDAKIKERNIQKTGKLNYEPLEVLTEMLQDSKFTDRSAPLKGCIGGSPQVMVIYLYMRTVNFGIYWQIDGRRVLTSRGRVLKRL